MAKFVTYALSYVQWLMMGKPRLHQSLVAKRRVECLKCDELQYDPADGSEICQQCGCSVTFDSDKLTWPHTECPLKKWGKVVQDAE